MTLNRLRATNFKCFQNLDLPLCKLTLLTGYNGAGKSSALQPLLLMSQALRESNFEDPRTLPMNGSLVRLGSAGDVINRDQSDNFISFDFEASDIAQDTKVQRNWTFALDRQSDKREFQAANYPNDLKMKASGEISQGSQPPEQIHQNDQNTKNHKDQETIYPIIETIGETIFISAIRTFDLEVFPFPNNDAVAPGNVGLRGEYAPYWYIRQADDEVDEVRRHPEESRLTVRGQIDAWFKDLFEGASVNAESVPGIPVGKLNFRIGSGSDWRRPSNVGFGLSYAFPIITALVCSKPGQVIVIDSPEAHLHPSAQSKFGEMLVHFAMAGVQLLVESHSDHLLSGIRLAVKRGKASPSDLAIHFFAGANSDNKSNTLIKIDIESDGTVANWPDGFFDQGLKDLVELS